MSPRDPGRLHRSLRNRILKLERDLRDPRDHHFDPDHEKWGTDVPVVDLVEGLDPKDFPVFDQGHLNSCTANVLSAAVMMLRKQEGRKRLYVPSRLYIWWKERKMEGQEDQNAACYMRDGLRALNRNGICPEAPVQGIPDAAVWPYDKDKYTEKPPPACFTYGKSRRRFVYGRVKRDLAHFRKCLADGHPFTIGISTYPNWYQAATNGGHIPMPDDKGTPGGHALLVVGYDDNEKRLKVRNSFGDDWGDGGYGTLPYEFALNRDYAWALWTIRATKERVRPSVKPPSPPSRPK